MTDNMAEVSIIPTALSDVELDDLYAALADPGLSPERRQRLLGVTIERIVNSPRGALGVRMDIGRDDLIASLLNLRAYVESRPKLWYTVIDDSAISREWAEESVKDLVFK
jgi:hypothetical protein